MTDRATVRPERLLPLNARPARTAGPVLYWMSRDQRADDNWALLHAQQAALARGVPLAVVFTLVSPFLGAPPRAFAFMLAGLEETERHLRRRGIPLVLLHGDPARELPAFAQRAGAALVVADFDPLRLKTHWRTTVAAALDCPLIEVDAHNVVPARHASPKLEYGAYTLRPKLRRLLPTFLEPFPALARHPHAWSADPGPADWNAARRALRLGPITGAAARFTPGPRAGLAQLRRFIAERLADYPAHSRDPARPGLSDLSPWLHFGQLAPQRVALAVRDSAVAAEARDAYLEQLIVRRELSDNFCLYNPHYDSTRGFPPWATRTLAAHAGDPRPHRYTRTDLEAGRTHDPLWNAAQLEMVQAGKMHGYMRMYWAKKILEWTPSADEALATVIDLNDRYELDGRDPNGYAGAAWSIGGVHDRPWGERPIFGTIRYMSANGCKAKFDTAAYIRQVAELA